MDFVAIDVETANPDWSSICQIGMVNFRSGMIVDEWSTLVDPQDYFDPINTSLHGLTRDSVRDAPLFGEILPSLMLSAPVQKYAYVFRQREPAMAEAWSRAS